MCSSTTTDYKDGYFVCSNCGTWSRGSKVFHFTVNDVLYKFCEHCTKKEVVIKECG